VQDYSVNDILEGILKHDQYVLNFVYKKFFKEIRYYITKNNGNEEDARDIFQEGLIVIYRQIKEEQLKLTCEFNTYLYSICRFMWLKHLNRKKVVLKNNTELCETIELEEEFTSLLDDHEKYSLYQQHYNKLVSCQL